MVPLGDPRLPEPFDIDCKEKGGGRWVDGRNWVYSVERDLPAGVRCTFTLKTGVKTLDGSAVNSQSLQLKEAGPAILVSYPKKAMKPSMKTRSLSWAWMRRSSLRP